MGSVFIQSVERAFRILEYISANNSAGVSELSRALDINKSTVFGLIKTLEKLGYILKNKKDDKYSISYKFYTLSSRPILNLPIIDICKPYLEKLNKEYDETVHLVVSTESKVVYILKLDGNQSIGVSTKIGSEMPLHCTGVGKAILALRDDEEILEYVKKYGLEAYTKNTITNKYLLMDEIELIRSRGYSIDDEEVQNNLYCIAIALKYNNDEYAISLSMPKFRIDENREEIITKDLLSIKENIYKYFSK